MGKNKKQFGKNRSVKRKNISSKNFHKKKNIYSHVRSNKSINDFDNGQSVLTKSQTDSKQEELLQEEPEDENAYNMLINSFKGSRSDTKCITSSEESDYEDDSMQAKQSVQESVNTDDSESDISLEEVEALEKDSHGDPFEIHFQRDLSDDFHNILSATSKVGHVDETKIDFPALGKCTITRYKYVQDESKCNKLKTYLPNESEKQLAVPAPIPVVMKTVNWDHLFIKTQIHNNIATANSEILNCKGVSDKFLTPLQKDLFAFVNNYYDVYYPGRTFDNCEEIRFIYCLHAINHALKTRLKVIHHNSRLTDKTDIPEEFRDQGLVRPKVLIIIPFRESALRVINTLISILLSDDNKANVVNMKRFYDEFTGGGIIMPRKKLKPLDYEQTFIGNTDDNFKIGISVTKKSLKLYADFYSSDIIVASPLALRMLIGAEGEKEREFDFLASIEVLVLDQAEIFLMQNWDHLLHVFDHIHCQPQQSHGTNFSRVRNWSLNGWAKYYRQTLIFSCSPLPLITALFGKRCFNYAGKMVVTNTVQPGTICQVAVKKVPQVFCRIDCSSSLESVDTRFTYFVSEILPQMRDPSMKHTLIYVPSYLDYVMIRNHFKKELISFVQISEYSKDGKVAQARDKFFHAESHFLLYSERFHFFRRVTIKGIRHLIFYQPPTFSHFYSEMCNLLQDATNLSITTMYTKFDFPQLSAIVNTDRANRMLMATNSIHKIVAE